MDNSADFMIVVVAAAALCIGAAAFVAIGIQFRRGRWLRLIAGNTFASDDELGSPEQKALGRRMSVAMFVGGLALVIQACFHVSDALGPSGLRDALFVAMCGAYACLLASIAWVFWKTYRKR